MWQYIQEQPKVLMDILAKEDKSISLLTEAVIEKEEIIITASGSSLNAAMIVKSLVERCTNKRITIISPFELRYYSTILDDLANKKLLIALSQTGKSVGTLECIQLAKEKKVLTIAITAYDNSPIAKEASLHINMLCGDELVGPKTKGFTSTVLMLHLVLMKICQVNNHNEIIEEYKRSILELPLNIKNTKQWCSQHREWANAQAMSIVGFGVNNPTAREGALKVLETMQIPVMNFDMEEFMHGPHRTIVPQSFIIMVDTDGSGQELMENLIQFSSSKTDSFLVISTRKEMNEHVIHIGNYPLTSSWLNAVIPFQIMCTYFPEVNGVNSSDPVYGDFATTVGTRIQ